VAKLWVAIGDHSYRTPVARMDGRFRVPLSAENRSAAGVAAGDAVEVDISLDAALDAYRARAAATDTAIRSMPLDQVSDPDGWAGGHDLRWVVLHLINETARHAGHADATRELLDGTTGE